jgi:hypothetical protein
MRLPSKIDFPFGYAVKVRLVTDAQMALYSGRRHRVDGLWDDNLRVIYIRRAIPLDAQIDALLHEVRHAQTEWDAFVRDEIIWPIQKAMAATARHEAEDV